MPEPMIQQSTQRSTQPARQPSVIVTSAYGSRSEELDQRRRRYVWAMTARAALFALSVLFLRDHLWALLPAMAVSAIAPYVAVVLANGGRKKPEMAERYVVPVEPIVAIGPGRTIDG